jgi:hypothetical protein
LFSLQERNIGEFWSPRKRIVEKNSQEHAIEYHRTSGRVMNYIIEYPKPILEKKRVSILVLDGNKLVLEGEGIEGQCSCEGILLHR